MVLTIAGRKGIYQNLSVLFVYKEFM